MQRVAFKMHLHAGCKAEYERRHDAIWPELADLLKQNGIQEYSIFLDETTNVLFGCLTMADPARLDRLPAEAIMQKWWEYMKDIMDTNPDNSPVTNRLKEVFYLP
jgi:L-rhamnose mutarotase